MENKKRNQETEKNNNLEKKIEDVKEELQEKAKDIKEDLTEKTKELQEDIKIKSKEIKEDLKETTKDIKKELKEKTEEFKDKAEDILNDIKDSSKKFDKKDIEANKPMAVLAYILAPIPYFVETKSKWVRYHAIQGMNLLLVDIILALIVTVINTTILWILPFLALLLNTALSVFVVVFALMGIINVCNCEAKELPLINKFKFIKK